MTDNEEARRMALYGMCERCHGPRDIRVTATDGGNQLTELICPVCEAPKPKWEIAPPGTPMDSPDWRPLEKGRVLRWDIRGGRPDVAVRRDGVLLATGLSGESKLGFYQLIEPDWTGIEERIRAGLESMTDEEQLKAVLRYLETRYRDVLSRWTTPPGACPITGWPQIDRDDLELCSCGYRHIKFEVWGTQTGRLIHGQIKEELPEPSEHELPEAD